MLIRLKKRLKYSRAILSLRDLFSFLKERVDIARSNYKMPRN